MCWSQLCHPFWMHCRGWIGRDKSAGGGQEMQGEAGALSQVVWPGGWRVKQAADRCWRKNLTQLSEDPVLTYKFNAIILLAGCKIALPGGLRESIPLAQGTSPAGSLTQLLTGFL